MKKQNISKLNEIKSQKPIENSPNSKYSFKYQQNLDNKNRYNKSEEHKNIENSNEYKNNSYTKKGKMGKLEYEIEPRNILLIPDNFNVKNKNYKICEKDLLCKEKNYFISETNFQLIKDALNEKEKKIIELNLLINKNNEQNNDYIKKISLLEEENKKLEEANNELILQIQKKDIYFNKMYQLIKFVFNYYNSFNEREIKKFIKEQNLEILLNKNILSNNNKNKKNNTDENIEKNNLLETLFNINQDMLIQELEKYKKMYNDIRKQLSYLTNMKLNEKDNKNDINSQQLLEMQKKLNELYFENQKYMKENSYLKLLCQNMFLEKKISDIDDNNDKDEKIKELEDALDKEKNINKNLIKENELLKKENGNLVKTINQHKLDNNKLRENYDKKIQMMNSEFIKIKFEKERLEKLINDKYKKNKIERKINFIIKNSKTNENANYKNNNIYSRKMILETSKINKSFFKRYKVQNIDKLFYPPTKRDNIYDKYKMNIEKEGQFSENIDNIDLLMMLYNKSNELELKLKE